MSEKHSPYEANDTGHEWDGIRELDNPPPRWWMIGLHISWISVLVYCILFPSVPLVNSATKGLLGWTQVKKFNADVAEVEAMRKPYENEIEELNPDEILKDAELSAFAQKSAKAVFGDHCAACHGGGGQGGPGFPVLADDEWLYGGKPENIVESITYGREGMMPAHGSMLSRSEVDDVVKYVAGLSKGDVYGPGRAVFMGETEGGAACFGCHGEDAGGIVEMGAPNLTDAIWRFDGSDAGIRYTITHGVNDPEDPQTRKALMPAFGEKLSERQIKKLAVLVHRFGGGR